MTSPLLFNAAVTGFYGKNLLHWFARFFSMLLMLVLLTGTTVAREPAGAGFSGLKTYQAAPGAISVLSLNYTDTKVFDGHNQSGTLQPAGTYFYLLQYKAGREVKHKSGYIILKY